jgi:hypothetical protein
MLYRHCRFIGRDVRQDGHYIREFECSVDCSCVQYAHGSEELLCRVEADRACFFRERLETRPEEAMERDLQEALSKLDGLFDGVDWLAHDAVGAVSSCAASISRREKLKSGSLGAWGGDEMAMGQPACVLAEEQLERRHTDHIASSSISELAAIISCSRSVSVDVLHALPCRSIQPARLCRSRAPSVNGTIIYHISLNESTCAGSRGVVFLVDTYPTISHYSNHAGTLDDSIDAAPR